MELDVDFHKWATSLTQKNVDYLEHMDRAYPGFTKRTLRKLVAGGYCDEDFKLVVRDVELK